MTKPLARDDDDRLVLGDLIDHLLNKGVVIQGEVVLSLAGVDLVYLRLQAMLSAADRAGGRRRKT